MRQNWSEKARDSKVAEQMFHIACVQVAGYNILSADRDDVALDFVCHMLENPSEVALHQQQPATFERWLHRCAANFLTDFQRHEARRRKRETALPCQESETNEDTPIDIPDTQPGPEAQVVSQEVWEQIIAAAQHLRPLPRALFLRHYVQDETLQELAQSTGRAQTRWAKSSNAPA